MFRLSVACLLANAILFIAPLLSPRSRPADLSAGCEWQACIPVSCAPLLALKHVVVLSQGRPEALHVQAAKFITQKLQTHLRQLPSTCTWSAHILALRRPTMHLHHDQDMMVAYALCRKAARLGCSGSHRRTLLIVILPAC